jgi:ubiquinol-cytochrome c reductase cytochrome c1 subunit
MKRFLLVLLAVLTWSGAAVAAGAGLVPWDRFDTKRVTDMAALQRGAKLFSNYCLNCHSAGFMRYNRLRDIGLTDQQIKENLIFTGAKVGDLMHISMQPADAKEWFGAAPPDLTLIARSRAGFGMGANSGADYIYTFLRTYYRDETKATGWNNAAFPNVGMPFPLWELQGQQRAIFETRADAADPAKQTQVFKGFETAQAGSMTEAQYNEAAADLTAFLFWMAEPNQNSRVRIGVWVMLFLSIFVVIAWRLNAAYWKDVK